MNILDGPGSIQERLAGAFRTEVQYVGPEELDGPMIGTLESINDEMTKVPADGDKDTIDMSTSNMTDDEAQGLADQIRAVYQYVSRHH
jgi:hypothetical protein